MLLHREERGEVAAPGKEKEFNKARLAAKDRLGHQADQAIAQPLHILKPWVVRKLNEAASVVALPEKVDYRKAIRGLCQV